jgi:hypothetical protein
MVTIAGSCCIAALHCTPSDTLVKRKTGKYQRKLTPWLHDGETLLSVAFAAAAV